MLLRKFFVVKLLDSVLTVCTNPSKENHYCIPKAFSNPELEARLLVFATLVLFLWLFALNSKRGAPLMSYSISFSYLGLFLQTAEHARNCIIGLMI